jgi:chemotaxis protein MotB
MQQDGVRANQVTQVRGYADQLLRVKTNPYDPSNRRISILVKNDAAPVPAIANARVTSGPAPPAPNANTGAPLPSEAPVKPTSAQKANPSKAPASQPVAKPGLVARIKSWIPGKRK